MQYFEELSRNHVLWTSVFAWFIAQLLKVILVLIEEKRLDFKRFIGAGGMPSSHSSFAVSLACSVGFVEGFNSIAFAICFCFALVVMYDAAGVRRSAGQQAAVLNRMIRKWEEHNFKDTDKELKELLGHTPLEVVAGGILGFIISFLRFG